MMFVHTIRRLSVIALWAALWLPLSASAAEPPKVVASIKPVHSLVAGVMAGVATPGLVVAGNASPHSYALKPSDAAALSKADMVFWVGEALETYLEKPIAALGGKATAVELIDTAGLTLLPTRGGGVWEADDDHDHHGHHDGHENTDSHVWLDIGNAKILVGRIAEILAGRDGANAAAYRANAGRMQERLDQLDAELDRMLQPVRERPFIVLHDAYQYFEKRHGLTAAGAIAVTPEQRPSARRLNQLRAAIGERGARCVFAEPQVQPALVKTVVEGTAARTGTLDPEGTLLDAGPELYFMLMRGLANSLLACLS